MGDSCLMQILLHVPKRSDEDEKRLQRSLQSMQQEMVFEFLRQSPCEQSVIQSVFEALLLYVESDSKPQSHP